MVGARDRYVYPFGAAVPQAARAVPQSPGPAPHRMAGRARARRNQTRADRRRRLMRVLLTGSSGWLGRFLAPMLRAKGHHVIGLDVAPGVDTEVIGSVADRGLIDRVFGERGIEAVIHGGALHKPDIVRYPAQAFVDVNVSGTLNLLEAAKAAGHDRFVFTSTTSLM